MDASARRAFWVVAATLAPLGTGLTQDGASTTGYDVEKNQSVQNAPAGSVGRKTTDREHRVGNAEETLGNESTFVLTFGGFARACPTSEGIVEGDFEYSVVYDGVEAGDDGVRREHQARRFTVQLRGQVGDDARLMYIDVTGEFTVEHNGTDVSPISERHPVQMRFTPGPQGEGDVPALKAVVEMTADVGTAGAVQMAGAYYRAAELEWLKPNACVEFTFEPPTDTETLAPNAARQVRTTLRSKSGGAAVPWASDAIGVIDSNGTVAPRRVELADSMPATVTYTASARPRRGHGFTVTALSRGGVGDARWRIVDRYEGTFTQVNNAAATVSALSGTTVETVTARIVWTPDTTGANASTFGGVASAFYKATAGEVTVELSNVNRNAAAAGSNCETRGRATFAVDALPPSKVQYFLLEIAADGRYKLVLGMPDYPETTWEADAVCRFAGGRSTQQKVPAMLPAVTMGNQEGTLNAERAVVGEMAPVRRGAMTTTGSWSFAPAE